MYKKVEIKDRSNIVEIGERKYKINVSDYDFIKKCKTYQDDLSNLLEDINKSNDYDELLNAFKSIIDFALNDDFDYIWETCNHDFKNLIGVATAISECIRDGMKINV